MKYSCFMDCSWICQKKLKFLLIGVCSMIGTNANAAEATNLLLEWSKIDVTGPLFLDYPDFKYESFIESRNQELRTDAAGGYHLSPFMTIWSGFTWIAPNTGAAQTYRPWQQLNWELLEKKSPISIQFRSRIEELKQQEQSEWLWRLRERLRLDFPGRLGKLTPVVYDEAFMNLNRPVWGNPVFFDANRAFIGVDAPLWKSCVVEIGYANQIRFLSPSNQVSHIILTYLTITQG